MIWTRINGARVLQFYRDGRARAHMDPSLPRIGIMISAGTLRSSSSGEAPNVTLEMENKSGQSSKIFAVPPLGELADILDGDSVIGTAAISAVVLDDTCSIEAQG